MARLTFLILAVAALGLCGCSPYVADFQYVPHPALAEIAPQPPDKSPPVSAFASVIGVYVGDAKQNIPESVQVRLRLENNGPHTVSFDPGSLELMTGQLQGFPQPIVRPPQSATLAPMQTAIYDIFFPFPPGYNFQNTELSNLQLRWSERIDSSPVRQVVSFRRTYQYYYSPDPYWYWGYPGFYGGGVIVFGGGGHRWR